MNQNGYNIKIICNNERVHIHKKCGKLVCSLPNNSKYAIELKNNNLKPIDAYLRIDGKKMGAYRIIPDEVIEISRPIRRRKHLTFLRQDSEMESAGLFNKNNPKLGQIEVIFRSGELYDPDETDIVYAYNKQVYRLEDYDFDEEYMNKYKKIGRKKKITEESIESTCEVYDECSSIPIECEIMPSQINEKNGFTAYSSVNESKYKTYQALDYDGKETKIIIELEIQKFESL